MVLMYANVLDKNLSRDELSQRYWGWQGDILDTLAVGTPERVAEVIAALRDAGVAHFCLDLSRHGYDHIAEQDEQLERFATEVVPLLEDNSAATLKAGGQRAGGGRGAA
jgi:alkanesulfonate monooxygenase SsuD/methylene tetrahydromethanopterin reductase-like flavin-dependent oxidoreductase (luciferase family)